MPHREHEDDGENGEKREHEDEAQPRSRLFALAPDPRVAARAVVVVRPVDRLRVDRWIVRSWDRPAGGLGHPSILRPYFDRVGK
jgi:hypothetical protein